MGAERAWRADEERKSVRCMLTRALKEHLDHHGRHRRAAERVVDAPTSSSTACATRARRSRSSTPNGSSACADVPARARPRDDRRPRRRDRHRPSNAGRTCSATSRPTPSCPRSTSSPRTSRRSSTRRARPDGPRARSARTATSAATSSRSRSRAARADARGRPERRRSRRPGQNVYLLSVPFFHATGCHSVLVANLAAGGKLVLMHKWDAERALELIERERVTTFGGVPAMVWQVLQSPSFETRDISSVQSIGYGGAPAPPELVRRIEQLFPGRTPSNGYGLTETSSVTTLQLGRRLPAQARQRRRAGRGRRRAGRRRRRQRRARPARSASCGSRARTS